MSDPRSNHSSYGGAVQDALREMAKEKDDVKQKAKIAARDATGLQLKMNKNDKEVCLGLLT